MDEYQNDFEQNDFAQASQSPEHISQEEVDLNYFNTGNVEHTHYSGDYQSQYNESSGNVLKASLFAALFGLGGCVVFGVLYYLGLIAYLAAALISFLAGLGYKKFNNDTMDKKGRFITFAISLVELLLSILVVNVVFYYPYCGLADAISYSISLFSSTMFLVSDVLFSVIFLIAAVSSNKVYFSVGGRRERRHRRY